MDTPERSLQQRRDALARANVVRISRKELKRDLKAGRIDFSDVLYNVTKETANMKVVAILLALPKVGRTKAEKALRGTGTSPSRTLGGLTERQRLELISRLT